MLKRMLSAHVLLCLTLLAALVAGPLLAQELPPQGICLYREPAPPMAALNDGTGEVLFYWTIDYATQFNQDYTLEIVPPAPASPFTLQSFPGGSSPIIDTAIWQVPAGTPAGCYYARLTFFSDWCTGSPNKYEARAVVGFIISPAARLQLYKFLDLNGNGIDDGEPPLEGWQFTVQRTSGGPTYDLVTGADGYTAEITVPVDATGATSYTITEVNQPGWVKTAPDGDTNPVDICLIPGEQRVVEFGNWQPITISGFKALDEAPWPWTDPHWVGSDGQENTSDWEPTFAWPFQPSQVYLAKVPIELFGSGGLVSLGKTVTDDHGYFRFDDVQWEPSFVIVEGGLPADPPPFLYLGVPPICASHDFVQWPGDYVSTVAISEEGNDFVHPDTIELNPSEPTEDRQEYGNNVFFNSQPSRVWGIMCTEALKLGLTDIAVKKDTQSWPGGDSHCCPNCGLYIVNAIPEEPEGLRCGEYTLTPPALPAGKEWVAVEYEFVGTALQPRRTLIGSNGSYTVTVPCGADIRVDFCIQEQNTDRICYQPVTFTQDGWKAFAAVDNTMIPGGMIYNKLPRAFKNFSFFGVTDTQAVRLLVGSRTKNIKFEATTGGMQRLVSFMGQTGRSGKLDKSYLNPWDKTSGGALAGETVALMMNIAYNDQRLMPRTSGYNFENFIVKEGLFKGKKVGEVLNIANAVLGGDLPAKYSLPKDPNDPLDTGYNALVAILHAINANYEFVDFATYNDHGYLIQEKYSTSLPGNPVNPVVPFQ